MTSDNVVETSERLGLKIPLLLQGAVQRTGDDQLPGAYCSTRHVWILDGQPLLSTPSSILEMVTKTRQELESDDQRDSAFLEMLTKTEAQLESDDDRMRIGLAEMETKTSKNIERDD